MYRSLAIILLALASTKGIAAAAPVRTCREVLDLRYHPGGGNRHLLDVFAPLPAKVEGKGPLPVVIFVHGGTWMMGDKNFFGLYRGVGKTFASSGLVTVVINYRLSPVVRHPEHIKDVARAFAWTYRNIHRYGGDPNRIFLAGHSAGAHLVSLLATDSSYLKDSTLKLDDKARSSICGVISISGVYRIPDAAEFRVMAQRVVDNLVGPQGSGKVSSTLGPALMLASGKVNPFGLVFGKGDDVQLQASPLHHVRKGLPPFLLLNAEREVPGLWKMADDFHAALEKHMVQVACHEVPGVTHRTIVKCLHDSKCNTMRLILEFVEKQALAAAARMATPMMGTGGG